MKKTLRGGVALSAALISAMSLQPMVAQAGQPQDEAVVERASARAEVHTVDEFFVAVENDAVDTIALAADLRFEGYTDADGKRAFVHLDGKTLDLGGHAIYSNHFSVIFDGSDFTIKNGQFKSLNKSSYPLFIGENPSNNVVLSNLTVDGGVNVYNSNNVVLRDVKAIGSSNYYAIWVDSDANVVIESGSYTSPGAAVLGLASKGDQNGGSSMVVKGGVFTVPGQTNLVLDAGGSSNYLPSIEGGTYNTEDAGKYTAPGHAVLVDEAGKVSAMTEADAIAKAGAAVEKDGKKVYYTTEKAAENNNPSTGEQKPEIEVFVAEVGGKKFATLEEAIAVAKDGGTVTLLKDLGPDEVSTSDKKYINITEAGTKVTIDLADHTISLNAMDTVSVRASNVTLKIMNGTVVNTHKESYGLYTYATNSNIDVVFENLTLRTVDQAIGVQGLNTNQNVTLRNCIITCETTAVYWPPKSGTLVIDGTSIQGKSGVTVKGGKVVVKGDSHIKATGEKKVPDDYYDGNPNGDLISTGSAIYVESGYNDRDIAIDVQSGTFESEHGATVMFFAKEGESAGVDRDIAISGGTFVGEPPAPEFIVPGSGLAVDQNGNMSVVAAKLAFASDWVVDGVLVYDVKGGKAPAITEADLLKLVSVNVEGYTVSVDSSALPALNKAIGAADTSLSFDFMFTATKDDNSARAAAVDPLTLTVKLTDFAVVPEPDPAEKVTVTFETGIGSSFQQVVEVGSKLERPADPTRSGWKFVGWYTVKNADGTLSREWDFENGVVNGDMTLYGGWVQDGAAGKPTTDLPQTGDSSALPIAIGGAAGVVAIGAGVALSRRRKSE